jgi:hypothetical protein
MVKIMCLDLPRLVELVGYHGRVELLNKRLGGKRRSKEVIWYTWLRA